MKWHRLTGTGADGLRARRPLRMARKLLLGLTILTLVVVAAASAAWFLGADDSASGVVVRAELRHMRSTIPARVTFTPRKWEVASSATGNVDEVLTYPGDVVGRGRELFVVDGRKLIAVNASAAFPRTLRQADAGDDVFAMQRFLAEEGYYDLEPSGAFDDATRLALEEWQHIHKLPVTGIFEPRDVLPGTWPARVVQVRPTAGAKLNPGQAALVMTDVTGRTVQVEFLSSADAERVRVGNVVEWANGSGTLQMPEPGVFQVDYQGPGGLTEEFIGREAHVLLGERSNVLAVPVEAIRMRGDVTFVVIRTGGEDVAVGVKTGLSDGAYIEVKGAVQNGDTLVLEREK